MSTLGKFFAVLVLIFAIAVAVANMVLFAQRQDWKGKYDEALDAKGRAEQNLKVETERYNTNLDAQSKEIERLNVQLDNARGMLAALQTAKARAEEDSKQIHIQFEDLRASYDKMARNLETLIERNETLAAELRTAETQAASDRRAREAAEDKALQMTREVERLAGELKRANERLAKAELEIEKLRGELAKLMQLLEGAGEKLELPAAPAVPLIEGKVQEIGDLPTSLVILNVGEDDGVYVGLRFIVYRGAKYVGDAVVEQVFQDYCAARPIRGTLVENVKPGDDVSTKLGLEVPLAEAGS
ncbi:MAG: hypothetical protein AMS15_01995 [Planctomycetes bacterium DG_23]|nr:MAG: hypothetical protein AMS15_01995 [Planctomycetes bacterium DG_23]